jgi:hypothetical protein
VQASVGFLTAKIAQERARRELKSNYYWLSYCGGIDRVHFEIRVGLIAGSRNRFATDDFIG